MHLCIPSHREVFLSCSVHSIGSFCRVSLVFALLLGLSPSFLQVFIFFSIFQLYEYDEEYFIVSSLSRLARANQLNFMRFLSVSIQRTFLLARLILRGDFSLFLLFSTLLFSFLLGASLCLHRSFLPFHLKTL